MQTFSQKSNRRRNKSFSVLLLWLDFLNHKSWTENSFRPTSTFTIHSVRRSIMSIKLKACLCGKCVANLSDVGFSTFGEPNKKTAKKIAQFIRNLRNKHGAKMLPRTVDFYLSHETIVVKNFFGKVIGVISIIIWDDSNIEVVSHAIHPAYQGQGLGALLFDKMKKKLRLFNPGAIFCFTNQVEFYEKLGFVKTDPAQFGKKIQDNCNGCPNGPNGPGFDPCPEFAMRYTGNPWKKHGEMHC